VGIAAGMRGKVKIGEVVFAERIVAYEPAALAEKDGGGREEQRRPEILEVPHTVQQDVAGYGIDGARLLERYSGLGWEIPRDEGWQGNVVTAIDVKKGVTIASGEKLLRDPGKLREVRADIHGKVEAGDMEAHGFARACEQQSVPWLVIRGISDFGDSFKDDRFHDLAARTAAVAMVDFLERGLDLGRGVSGQTAASAGPSPFVWGRPIDRDDDFIGRTSERQNIEEAIRKKLAITTSNRRA
jgi:nucleoside phosphorylase